LVSSRKRPRGEGDQAGGQNWAQRDRKDGGSGQGSASSGPPRVYQLKEKPIVTDLGGTSGGAHLGGASCQGGVHLGSTSGQWVFILVVHLVGGCASTTRQGDSPRGKSQGCG
jgi:hypothetical protein